MLPQQYRLKNQKAFEATYRQRQVVSDTLLSLHIGKKKPENFSGATKIGFVVSKKLHKRATKRNRIKRLMREACRLELKNNGLKNGEKYLSLIFLPKPQAFFANFRGVQKSVQSLLEKIR